ncbi:MAG: DJ-1/PfpI family protein [Reinekea sp.]
MKTVLVPLADDCEEMEAITITDILTRAGAKVTTAGLKEGPVRASRGARLLPDVVMSDVQDQTFDLIALPGGLPGADHLAQDAILQDMIKRQNSKEAMLAAVCAAPKALASAGVLSGRKITSYPGSMDALTPDWSSNSGNKVEIDGHIVTGRGPGVALEFALTLVENLFGADKRAEVEAELVL